MLAFVCCWLLGVGRRVQTVVCRISLSVVFPGCRVLIAVISTGCQSLFLFRCPALPTPTDISAEMVNLTCMYVGDNCAGIFLQSMGARNRVGIGFRQNTRPGGIGSLESILGSFKVKNSGSVLLPTTAAISRVGVRDSSFPLYWS